MFIMKKKKMEREREKDIREEMQDKIVQDALDRSKKSFKKKAKEHEEES